MFSVMMLGCAIAPASRWSRVNATGPDSTLLAHHAVDFQAELGAFAMTEPGDAGREPLERDAIARELHPVGDDLVRAEATQQQVVDLANIVGIVGERDPAERADGARKQRPQECLA